MNQVYRASLWSIYCATGQLQAPNSTAIKTCQSWALQWRHNGHDSVSNHQPHDCLLKRLFRHRSKKTSKLCITGLCVGNSPGPVNSPHKGPVTRKMFPFDDVIMDHRLQCHWIQWIIVKSYDQSYWEIFKVWSQILEQRWGTDIIFHWYKAYAYERWCVVS